MLMPNVSMSGGSSSADSKTQTGDTSSSSAGMKSGAFINNFAAPGASLTSKADNANSTTPASAGSLGLLAVGAGLLLFGVAAKKKGRK